MDTTYKKDKSTFQFLRLIVVAIVFALVSQAIYAIWAEFYGPVADEGFPLTQKWVYQVDETIRAISDSSGDLILLRSENAVYAVDSVSGSLVWNYPLKNKIYITTAKTLDGTVYVVGNAWALALDQKSGDVIWKRSIQLDSGTEITMVSNKSLLINNASKAILALDNSTGQIRWQVPTSRGPTILFVDDSVVYALNDGITEYDEITGNVIWERDEKGILSASYQNHSIYYVRLLKGASSGTAGRYEIVAFDTQTNIDRWRVELNGSGNPEITKTEEIVLVSLNPSLFALDPETGEVQWQAQVKVGLKPIHVENRVYIFEGFTRRILALDDETGQLLGYLDTAPPRLAYTDREILVSSGDRLVFSTVNKVYAYGK